jgi:hypothetical protein
MGYSYRKITFLEMENGDQIASGIIVQIPQLVYSLSIPDINHPKCGAKMQRENKRTDALFVPCSWLCTDCGLFKKDN